MKIGELRLWEKIQELIFHKKFDKGIHFHGAQLHVEEAPEPTEICWEHIWLLFNFYFYSRKKPVQTFFKRIVSNAIIFIFLLIFW